MRTPPATDAPATAWARTRGRVFGASWETLEAHLFAAHPEIQLILRVRGRALPNRGAWYLTAFAAAAAAGPAAFAIGPSRPAAALAAAGALLAVAAACELVGCVRSWQGYGTTADAVWGGLVLFAGAAPAVGVGMLAAAFTDAADRWATFVFWLALAVSALGFTGLQASTLTPGRRSARQRRAIEAAAALPGAERERLRADLEGALSVLVDRGIVRPGDAREALEAPLGGLASSRCSESPG